MMINSNEINNYSYFPGFSNLIKDARSSLEGRIDIIEFIHQFAESLYKERSLLEQLVEKHFTLDRQEIDLFKKQRNRIGQAYYELSNILIKLIEIYFSKSIPSRYSDIYDFAKEIKSMSRIIITENPIHGAREKVQIINPWDFPIIVINNQTLGREKRTEWGLHRDLLIEKNTYLAMAQKPPYYVQPLHFHTNTAEFSMNLDGNTQGMFLRHGQKIILFPEKYDHTVFSQNTVHTLANSSARFARDITYKPPCSYKDRRSDYERGADDGKGYLEPYRYEEKLSKFIRRFYGIPYFDNPLNIELTFLQPGETISEKSQSEHFYYVAEGSALFSVDSMNKISKKDTVCIVAPDKKYNITSHNKKGVVLYRAKSLQII
ncbi:hypothetical protein GF327_04805 [Candidatus Woesearchaeota archaeon]|nr:hypothetical protein [Candidatus Woesearchaeota archaeon]